MGIEPDEHELMLECGNEIVVSYCLTVFVVILVCFFVCLDSQYCVFYQYAVVDASTVKLVNSEHHFVMCKPLECHVDRRAHSVFWSYCTKARPRISWELVHKTTNAMLVVFWIKTHIFTDNTQRTPTMQRAMSFGFSTRAF